MVFTAFLLGAQHEENRVEEKPASSNALSLRKPLNWRPIIFIWVIGGGSSSLTVAEARPIEVKDLRTKRRFTGMNK